MPTPTIVVQSDTTGTTINTLPAVGQTTSANSLPVVVASDQPPFPVRTTGAGVGALTAVPTASTNGTALGTMPALAKGARLYVPPGGSITFTIAAAQPSSAPSVTIPIANPSTNTLPVNWDEDLSGQMIYVTASSGSPLFRWY